MGWSVCLATERDPESVVWLDRGTSNQLLLDDGILRPFIADEDYSLLEADDIGSPDHWEPRDAVELAAIFTQVRSRLREENERLSVDHFLWPVVDGERENGSTEVTIPSGPITLAYSFEPMAKLDGSHGDPAHRMELKKYVVTLDVEKFLRNDERIKKLMAERRITEGSFVLPCFGFGYEEPLVDVFDCWLPAQPVLDILGHRVEVESFDAIATYEPDLTTAIELCERAARESLSLFWLRG